MRSGGEEELGTNLLVEVVLLKWRVRSPRVGEGDSPGGESRIRGADPLIYRRGGEGNQSIRRRLLDRERCKVEKMNADQAIDAEMMMFRLDS